MKFFTSILEARKSEEPMSEKTFTEYNEKVGKKMPQDVQFILAYCEKYKLFTKEALDEIKSSNKTQLKKLSEMYSIPFAEIEDLQKLLSGLGTKKNLLPHYMSERMRQNVISGKKTIEDASLDLVSERGREIALKTYMPLINKIVSQYDGKSSLSRSELLSAALEGFTLAMNDYNAPDENYVDSGDKEVDIGEVVKHKKLTFKQYAAYRIQFAILGEMNDNSRVVRIPKSLYKKNVEAGDPSANYNSVAIDALMSDDPESESKADRMKELSVEMKPGGLNHAAENNEWKKIFAAIDNKFSVKMTSIFYKFFGLNGYKKMSGVDVAKEMGCTKAYVSKVIKQITTYLKDNPKTADILMSIRDLYTESLLLSALDKGTQYLLETFAQDDVYMMLEEITKWANPKVLASTIDNVISEYDYYSKEFILDCLENGFEYLDSHYRKNKKLIVHFLENMNPTESLSRKSDVYILDLMNTIISKYQKIK